MDNSKLTMSEKEVLVMLTEEFMTPKQIALRRQCSRQAISKIMKSLKEKGAINLGLQMVDKQGGTCQPVNQIRIHAQQYIIRILWKDHKYKKLLEKSNQLEIDGNTLDLYENSIYVSFNQSFYGDNVSHAFFKVGEYWRRFAARMEHELNCILIKPRVQNIKLTRIHIAETNNEIAKEIDNQGDRWFKVYAEDDGKLRFLVDNSFNLHEFEAVRSSTARPDMEKVGKVFNDIADKDHYLPSDTKNMIDKLAVISNNVLQSQLNQDSILQKTNQSVNWLAENIKSHGPAWLGMEKNSLDIKKAIFRLNKILVERQKKLGDYFA